MYTYTFALHAGDTVDAVVVNNPGVDNSQTGVTLTISSVLPPPLLVAGAQSWGAFQLLLLTWTNNSSPCVLESTGDLTGGWSTVSAPWTTNANWVSTLVASPCPAQFYRLRAN